MLSRTMPSQALLHVFLFQPTPHLPLIPICATDTSWYSLSMRALTDHERSQHWRARRGAALVETTEPWDDDRGCHMVMQFSLLALLSSFFSFFPPRGRTSEPAVTTWWVSGSRDLASLPCLRRADSATGGKPNSTFVSCACVVCRQAGGH